MKILIIEDEKLTAKDLAKTLIAIDNQIEVIQITNSIEETVAFLKTKPLVDLIFSDIELGDGLSFEIFEKLKITTPIIFCTAYNQYALRAFQTVGIDYVLKPFSKQIIEKTLQKYNNLKKNLITPKEDYSSLINMLKTQLQSQNQSLIINLGDKIIPLKSDKIALFYIKDDVVFAHTFEGKNYIISQTIDSLENQFQIDFFRANRQFLINRNAIKDASHHFNRKILINLSIPFKEQIMVGKLKTTAFTKWLSNSSY